MQNPRCLPGFRFGAFKCENVCIWRAHQGNHDARMFDKSHSEHTNHHLAGPPSLLFPLFGLWILKQLANRGAGLDNQNLESYLRFCVYLQNHNKHRLQH